MTSPSIVWLRDDLRLADNPALTAAVERGEPVVVLYLLDDETDGIRPLGAASRWWLHHSLSALDASLREIGGRLTLRRGPQARELPRLVDEIGAGAVFWNRRYGLAARDADADLKSSLRERGLDVRSFQANLMFEPWTIQTGQGQPFKVFTPFWRACLDRPEPRHPLAAPDELHAPRSGPDGDDLDSWQLLPTTPDWAGGLREAWTPGEASALDTLERFATGHLADYGLRDEPAQEATSHLSPHLRFGEVSPFQVWHRMRGDLAPDAREQASGFLRELVWREFNHTVLFANPHLATKNYRPEFDEFPWHELEQGELEAWQQGTTGIPLVDAGMRELWTTGYMHNRVRMVTASFLVKNLLADWRVGEQWFWDTLVDADEANNPANWQWTAGSGADAAPYFRVFNPVLQADKFDKHRDYVRRWVPEVDDDSYPEPMVDLKASRRAALDAYEAMRRSTRSD
ncbi:deoxyribodipyrimidine photo-lyase [Frigoribacterium sp. VKM Ac-1396]|uniref:cryptochrome/photolyase family protein n=1 Tax=Frigoribacterium sp. VKM Ac-1396 TaxID=2783821 RepID=UPI00188CF5CC|nr:deoxyribodipyrimidine photo-lyase [Frigoribacterium sp. VKM Ac-1396]MBF4600277.1 deoxyribodipyrimidine photo-lyase [Frigoribacterium sp. VKM Ac-1396]